LIQGRRYLARSHPCFCILWSHLRTSRHQVSLGSGGAQVVTCVQAPSAHLFSHHSYVSDACRSVVNTSQRWTSKKIKLLFRCFTVRSLLRLSPLPSRSTEVWRFLCTASFLPLTRSYTSTSWTISTTYRLVRRILACVDHLGFLVRADFVDELSCFSSHRTALSERGFQKSSNSRFGRYRYALRALCLRLLTSSEIGKTSLLYRLHTGELVSTIPTVGLNVENVKVLTRSGVLDMICWDVSSSDNIRPLWRHYFLGI
jgi:hypothetical protein